MASSIGSSFSSIDKIDEYETMLDHRLFRDGYVPSQKSLNSSDKSTSCSTRSSSYDSMEDVDRYVTFECFDDEEKKHPDTSSSAWEEAEEDNGISEIQQPINEVIVRNENICRERAKQREKSFTFCRRDSMGFCSGTCLMKYLGVFLFLVGTWLGFASFSYTKLISEATKSYVEGPFPIYLSCSAVSDILFFFCFFFKSFKKSKE